MDNNRSLSRRGFFRDVVKDVLKLTRDVKRNLDEGRRISDALSSFDDLPIASTYPKELFAEEARRLGIDIDALDEKEAIRRIVSLRLEQQKA
ncbi:MAG: hypothetical protein ACYDAA_11310 [Syntrophales bacterium]